MEVKPPKYGIPTPMLDEIFIERFAWDKFLKEEMPKEVAEREARELLRQRDLHSHRRLWWT